LVVVAVANIFEDWFRLQKNCKRPQNWSFVVSFQFLEMLGILRTSLSVSPRLLRLKTETRLDFQSPISWVLRSLKLFRFLRSAYKNKVVSALEEATAAAPKDWAMEQGAPRGRGRGGPQALKKIYYLG